jgi:hypothetical protein
MRDFAVLNVTARVDYFEPFQMVQSFVAFGERILDCILDAFR